MLRVLFLGNITVFSLVGDPVFDNFTVKNAMSRLPFPCSVNRQ